MGQAYHGAEKVVAELRTCAGRQFDRVIVHTFVEIITDRAEAFD